MATQHCILAALDVSQSRKIFSTLHRSYCNTAPEFALSRRSLDPNDAAQPIAQTDSGAARRNSSESLCSSPVAAIVRPGSLSSASLLAV